MNTNSHLHIKSLIAEAGLKATHPRIAVYHSLIKMEQHPTAEQVYSDIKENYPSISLGSVYRILEKFVESNLATRVASKSGNKRYDAKLEHHAHIYSINTEEIEDYVDEALNDLIKEYFKSKKVNNFKISEIKVQINGEKEDPSKKVTIV